MEQIPLQKDSFTNIIQINIVSTFKLWSFEFFSTCLRATNTTYLNFSHSCRSLAKPFNSLSSFPGASSGIGAATAVLFSKLGANLALSGRNVTNLQKTADQCQVADGQKKPLLVQGERPSVSFQIINCGSTRTLQKAPD